MDIERNILKKLIHELNNVGFTPIPNSDFLLKRINQKLESRDVKGGNSKKISPSETSNSSPVCFAKAEEVQGDYLNEEQLLEHIDKYIDQQILKYLL